MSRAIRKQPEENFCRFHPSFQPFHIVFNILNLQVLWSFDIRGVNMHDFPASALPFHNQRVHS
jgi:hypothetical protein